MLTLTAVLFATLAQPAAAVNPPEVKTDPAAANTATDERAVTAMERTAAAAERTAAAAEKIAQLNAAKDAAAEKKEAAAEGKAPSASEWHGTAGISLVSITGNAESLTLTGIVALERKTEHWIIGAKASGAYGQARPATDTGTEAEVVAMRAMGELRGDRRITEKVSAFVLAGAETDHVKSLEARIYGEGGASVVWVETKEAEFTRVLVRTDLALRYANEQRFQYYPTPLQVPDVSLLAPRFGVAFRYAMSKDVQFAEDAEILPNLLGEARVLVNSTTKLSSRLTESLALNVGFVVNYDSAPAPGKRSTDTALTAGIELAL